MPQRLACFLRERVLELIGGRDRERERRCNDSHTVYMERRNICGISNWVWVSRVRCFGKHSAR